MRFVRYSAVGWLGVAVQLTVLALLTDLFSLHYLVATPLAVESAILHNFFWHDRFTFGDRALEGSRRSRRLLQFNTSTGAVALGGNLLFMRLFVGGLDWHPLVGNVASIACCALANYLVSDRIVFAARGEVIRAG